MFVVHIQFSYNAMSCFQLQWKYFKIDLQNEYLPSYLHGTSQVWTKFKYPCRYPLTPTRCTTCLIVNQWVLRSYLLRPIYTPVSTRRMKIKVFTWTVSISSVSTFRRPTHTGVPPIPVLSVSGPTRKEGAGGWGSLFKSLCPTRFLPLGYETYDLSKEAERSLQLEGRCPPHSVTLHLSSSFNTKNYEGFPIFMN